MPYLRTLSTFRDGVRGLAMGKGDTALKDVLALCDKLRDIDLVPLGVALDDQEGKGSAFYICLITKVA
jgi:cysteinyl-tRNA synthetase